MTIIQLHKILRECNYVGEVRIISRPEYKTEMVVNIKESHVYRYLENYIVVETYMGTGEELVILVEDK